MVVEILRFFFSVIFQGIVLWLNSFRRRSIDIYELSSRQTSRISLNCIAVRQNKLFTLHSRSFSHGLGVHDFYRRNISRTIVQQHPVPINYAYNVRFREAGPTYRCTRNCTFSLNRTMCIHDAGLVISTTVGRKLHTRR